MRQASEIDLATNASGWTIESANFDGMGSRKSYDAITQVKLGPSTKVFVMSESDSDDSVQERRRLQQPPNPNEGLHPLFWDEIPGMCTLAG